MPHLPALRHLDLTGNRLGTRVPKADAVEWLTWASSLRSLDLSNNGFTRVPRLDSVPELRSLVLSWNAIKLLTNVDRVTGLLELDLSHNAFTGLIALHDLKTGRLYVLTSTELDESPSIAPNGSMVLYATKHSGRGILAAVSVEPRRILSERNSGLKIN